MSVADLRSTGHQSHAIGTGISLTVHVLIFSLLLVAAFRAPRLTGTPDISIALIAPNLSRPGAPGRAAGSGAPAAAQSPRKPEPATSHTLTLVDNPLVRAVDVSIPTVLVDTPALLPGSAIDVELGRGVGPGAGSQRGSGLGDVPGVGSGAGRDGIGNDGVGSGDGVIGPRLIHEVRPNYTVEAMRAKVQGQVELDVVVLPDGTVDPKRIRIARSLDATFGLDAQAVEAVKQWRFRPGTQNGRPVPVHVRVELTFTLR